MIHNAPVFHFITEDSGSDGQADSALSTDSTPYRRIATAIVLTLITQVTVNSQSLIEDPDPSTTWRGDLLRSFGMGAPAYGGV